MPTGETRRLDPSSSRALGGIRMVATGQIALLAGYNLYNSLLEFSDTASPPDELRGRMVALLRAIRCDPSHALLLGATAQRRAHTSQCCVSWPIMQHQSPLRLVRRCRQVSAVRGGQVHKQLSLSQSALLCVSIFVAEFCERKDSLYILDILFGGHMQTIGSARVPNLAPL
jgi:hypothetical protein